VSERGLSTEAGICLFCTAYSLALAPTHPANLEPVLSGAPSAEMWNLLLGIPVIGRGGPYGCETSRLPHFRDNRLTDGGEVVSLTRRPPFVPRRIRGTHFC
jgi:hypothetical protein